MTSHRPGHTLVELICGLAIIAITAGLFATPFVSMRDVLAVRAARDDLAAAAARTRSLAVGHGGAELRIDIDSGTIRIISRDSAVDRTTRLADDYRVSLSFHNTTARTAVVRYDALGIGRVASRTIAISRGGRQAGVTFSSYGRARTW